MKITPLAQGTGVPAQSDSSLGRTGTPDKIARAKAIAMGAPVEEKQFTGDAQVDRTQSAMKKIKMRTQVSQNRHEFQEPVAPVETLEAAPQEQSLPQESPITDTSEKTEEPEETRPLSPQFAALAKAKRALQVKERELEQRELALKTQAPAGNDDLIAKLKSNPLSVLQEHGVTYDQLTEAILNNQSGMSPELQELRSEIKALKEELTGQFSSRDQQAEKQVLAEIKREAMSLTAEGDQFEAIREARAHDDVVELIHRTFKETGEVMDVHAAAELVENQLIEEALPFARIKKIQSRLTPSQELAVEQTPTPQPKPNTKIMRTLTNRDNASPVLDRRARAIAAMQGTLRKG